MIINPYIFQTQVGPNPGFVPTTNLRLHLETRESNITFDGSNKVNLWEDITLYNHDAIQNNPSYKPTYNYSDVDMYFNKSITFSSASFDSMQITATPSLNFSANGFTVYLVCTIPQLTLYGALIQHSNDDTWTQGWGIVGASSSLRFFIQNWNSAPNYIDLPQPASNQRLLIKFSWDKTTMKASYRTASGSLSSSTKAYSGAYTNPTLPLSISASDPLSQTSGYVSSKFGAILMYDGVLSAQNELNLENYLKSTYGIS